MPVDNEIFDPDTLNLNDLNDALTDFLFFDRENPDKIIELISQCVNLNKLSEAQKQIEVDLNKKLKTGKDIVILSSGLNVAGGASVTLAAHLSFASLFLPVILPVTLSLGALIGLGLWFSGQMDNGNYFNQAYTHYFNNIHTLSQAIEDRIKVLKSSDPRLFRGQIVQRQTAVSNDSKIDCRI